MSLLPKRRVVIAVVGLALLAAFLWFAGPLFSFAEYSPLESENARIVAILLVVGLWAINQLRKSLRITRASNQLAAAVVREVPAEQPSTDAVQLREKFDAGVKRLKQKGRDGHTLYELPWYVMIGAPGSGKTTALVNSGLRFPLEQHMGRQPLQGVGGTRNCEWWLTHEAVLLDTAGRFTTQDSDAAADKAAWAEFLALLKKHRPRRPLNGVIIAVSAENLMVDSPREREDHVDALRRRLDELNRELRVQLPVYLLVTKCDLIAGFREYFDDLTQEGRAQVWGVTFSYEQTVNGEGIRTLPGEFDALVTRLNERLMPRIADERDRRRRTRTFGFPHQFSMLRDAVTELIAAVFTSTRFDRPVLLRGVYFTSGTQERTPIDRLLGAMSRRFGVAPEVVAPPPGKGKAYFIERLLRDVIIGESGLAGFNLRFEAKQAAAKLGAYVAIAALTVLAVSALWISYGNNRSFVGDVDAATARLDAVPPSPKGAPLDRVLPRLDAIRQVSDVANRYREDRRWLTMGWGLYEGNSIGDAARDAYSRELNGALMRTLKERFEAALREHVSNPQALFLYLKGYLMLGSPERLDSELVGLLADREWQSLYRDDNEAANRLSGHFRTLLSNGDGLRKITLDDRLVAQARRSLPFESVPAIIYSDVKQQFADDPRALSLEEAAGIGSERVFRRKSGVPLSQPLEAIYTKAVFKEITTRSAVELVAQFTEARWVWGEDRPLLTASATLRDEFIRIYEEDYIKAWDALLADITLVPLGTLEKTKDALATLGGDASPLKAFLRSVDENTNLVEPTEASPKSEGIKGAVNRALGDLTKKAPPIPTVQPGLRVTQHFAKIRQLLTGEGGTAKLDGVLQQIQQIQQKLELVGRGVGQTSPDDPKLMASVRISADALARSAAPLPPAVGEIVRDLGNRTASVSASGLRMTLEERYREDVVQECTALISGHYPFVSSDQDLPLADFAKLFGSGGLYDTFFKNELADLVDKQDQGWAWKPGAAASVPLEKFQIAEQLRRMFFPQGAATPGVTFTITPSELDDRSRRFVLEIDGQAVQYEHGAVRPVTIKWPGEKVGSASATFEEHTGSRSPIVFDGAWAWFRLLDAVKLTQQSDVRYSLAVTSGGHQADLRIDAHSVWNPFRQLGLLKFRC
jgi:type VI secretion system protein ImpL